MKFSLKKDNPTSSGNGITKGKGKVKSFSLKKKTSLKANTAFEAEEVQQHDIQIADASDLEEKPKEVLVIPMNGSKMTGSNTKIHARPGPAISGNSTTPAPIYGLTIKESGQTDVADTADNPPISTAQIARETEGVSATTLESYEKVPVEQFGMAMLRGMGYEENKEDKKEGDDDDDYDEDNDGASRPLLLGLGAKPSPAQLDPSYRVIASGYTPVTRDVAHYKSS